MDALTVSVGFFAVADVRPGERETSRPTVVKVKHKSMIRGGSGHEAQLIRVLERTIVRMV